MKKTTLAPATVPKTVTVIWTRTLVREFMAKLDLALGVTPAHGRAVIEAGGLDHQEVDGRVMVREDGCLCAAGWAEAIDESADDDGFVVEDEK